MPNCTPSRYYLVRPLFPFDHFRSPVVFVLVRHLEFCPRRQEGHVKTYAEVDEDQRRRDAAEHLTCVGRIDVDSGPGG